MTVLLVFLFFIWMCSFARNNHDNLTEPSKNKYNDY